MFGHYVLYTKKSGWLFADTAKITKTDPTEKRKKSVIKYIFIYIICYTYYIYIISEPAPSCICECVLGNIQDWLIKTLFIPQEHRNNDRENLGLNLKMNLAKSYRQLHKFCSLVLINQLD